jgi:predicted nucleotidyltransferase
VVLERAATEAQNRSAPGSVREKSRAPYPAVPGPALEQVCRRHHIRWLAAFGSWARGQARPESDVDLVAEFEPGLTPGFAIMSVEDALRPMFGGRRVDLVTARGLSPGLRERIQAEAVPLYGA